MSSTAMAQGVRQPKGNWLLDSLTHVEIMEQLSEPDSMNSELKTMS